MGVANRCLPMQTVQREDPQERLPPSTDGTWRVPAACAEALYALLIAQWLSASFGLHRPTARALGNSLVVCVVMCRNLVAKSPTDRIRLSGRGRAVAHLAHRSRRWTTAAGHHGSRQPTGAFVVSRWAMDLLLASTVRP